MPASSRAELRKVEEDLAALRGGTEGTVAFGIGPAIGLPLMPGAMARFRAEHPRARVRIREGMRNALPAPGARRNARLCGYQNSLKPPSPGFISGHSFDWSSPLRHAKVIRWRARRRCLTSLNAPWLVFYPPGSGGALERAFSAAGLPSPNGLVHCESYVTALALIARTDLLGLLPPEIIEEPMAHRYIQRIHVRESIPRPRIGIFMRADTPLSPTAALMMQALVSAARSRVKR